MVYSEYIGRFQQVRLYAMVFEIQLWHLILNGDLITIHSDISLKPCLLVFTRYEPTRVRPGLKLSQVSLCRCKDCWSGFDTRGLICRLNTAYPGSTRFNLERWLELTL